MKVTILGEGRVGKTSLLQRFAKGTFDEDSKSSISAAMLDLCVISPVNGITKVGLKIWDTAGQEKFRCIAPMYYKDADAVILVYNVTDAKSFSELQFWLDEVREKARENCIVAVAGNQADRVEEEKVSLAEATEFANKNGALFFLTSAKEGMNVNDLFHEVIARKYPEFKSTAPPAELRNVVAGATTMAPVPQSAQQTAVMERAKKPAVEAFDMEGFHRGSVRLKREAFQQNQKKPGCC